LAQVLRPLRDHPAARHPDLLVGTETSDDAGVYRLASGQAIVQTVDFFTPVVDDPYDWGRITAANALSDIYAMGAVPLTALQLLGWPRDVIPWSVASEVIGGGLDVMGQAGCVVVGGHSIDDPEPKYGFAVTGLVDPVAVVTNAGAEPGDALVLTKPLGIGIITTAIKRGLCPDPVREAAVASMVQLNDRAAAGLPVGGVHAATDVTGFGLLGHLHEMLRAAGVSAEIVGDAVPVLDGARELLEAGCWAGGSGRNLEAVAPFVDGEAPGDTVRLLADAQTSGGLLMAAADPVAVTSRIRSAGGDAWVIGRIVDRPGTRILVV